MPSAELHYCWTWELNASPGALWPLVSNTDRFNRDCGFPAVTVVPPPEIRGPRAPDSRRLRTRHFGFQLEWDERPFEWISFRRYGVERIFRRGPFASIRALCELTPRSPAGTTLTYQTWITPASLPGRAALLLGAPLLQFRAPFARVFAHYDRLALAGGAASDLAQPPRFAAGGLARLAALRPQLPALGPSAALVDRLADFVASADDLSVVRLRPYELADLWHADRRELLRLFLHATRAGLFDFSWDILCPLCRGAKSAAPGLASVASRVHCDACQIDFTANFDQSVELTFHPNPAIRPVARNDYCVGGPQITPHIVAQQTLRPGAGCTLTPVLAPGRYRLRSPPLAPQHFLRASPAGRHVWTVALATSQEGETAVALNPELTLQNNSGAPCRIVLEHLGWTDQAVIAADVTALQVFRDLFAREVLRPGEQISVGSLAVAFTDLRDSTRLYREIGDAPAFGRVLTHFEVLKAAVAAEDGAIVKTMGDAIMAVFRRPVSALRALLAAQRLLAQPGDRADAAPLALKAGLHYGPCLAINQNDRLDYFGSTVNLAARLSALSTGADLVCSAATAADPEVAQFLAESADRLRLIREQTPLRGFDRESFDLLRLSPARPAGG